MNFARKQLEKYGWTDGKGLGKHENGIAQALKPKLKRSVTGVGHDAAADFNDHWWSALYNKAAANVEVEDKKGKTKKIKTKQDFEITNSTWKLKKNKKEEKEVGYTDFFVKKAVLDGGGSRIENIDASESEEEVVRKDVNKLTDEELFAACGGRTAHKGARFGLKATGKLTRVAQQEQILLTQSRFEGYSHSKKMKNRNVSVSDLQVVEDMNLDSDVETKLNKKKKKKKHCLSGEVTIDSTEIENIVQDMDVGESIPLSNKKKKRKLSNSTISTNVASTIQDDGKTSKEVVDGNVDEVDEAVSKSKKKKKLKKDKTLLPSNNSEPEKTKITSNQYDFLESGVIRKKKKKHM